MVSKEINLNHKVLCVLSVPCSDIRGQQREWQERVFGVYLILYYCVCCQSRIAILEDNRESDKNVYLVCIITGWWINSSTTARVFMYIKGKQSMVSIVYYCFSYAEMTLGFIFDFQPIFCCLMVDLWHSFQGGLWPLWNKFNFNFNIRFSLATIIKILILLFISDR